jgi:5-(carboxyamino)imidazole ribonucleotide mutase
VNSSIFNALRITPDIFCHEGHEEHEAGHFRLHSSHFMQTSPLVGIIMGSDSDLSTMQSAIDVCEEFAVPYEVRVVSAHRTPADMGRYASEAHTRGLRVIIAGAGGAAHLPGMVAAYSPLPVIGVPVQSKALSGLDSLLSIVQMPAGVPVATVAIGAGRNAGLLAVQILATHDSALLDKMIAYKNGLADQSRAKNQILPKVSNVAE